MAAVFLLLGSNMGDPLDFIARARQKIGVIIGPITAASSCYQTAAWGKTDQADFINQVLKIETAMAPSEVLAFILQIELDLGRERLEKWSSRTIDIDILFYNQEIVDEPDLKIPHPNLHQRAFTLVPLCEIDSQWIHPVFNQSAESLLDQLDDQLAVRRLNL